MLLTPVRYSKSIKRSLVLFFIFCFIQTASAQIQPPVKDPSNPEGINVPTQMPPAQLYDMLKDKNSDNSNGKTI